MNIARILSSLDECDRKFFQESIADTLTYLTEALEILPASAAKTAEVTRLRRFKIWLEMFDNNVSTYNDVQSSRSNSDADDGAGDKALQEAYDIIATDDIDPTDTEQLATELMRGWH